MTAATVQLFVNPRPGRLARKQVNALHAAFAQRGAAVIVSESAFERLEVDARADHACAVGGDGTLRHVVDAVGRSGRPVTVSTFPTGTVNLLAMECSYSRWPQTFVERVLNRRNPRTHYVALIGQTPMLTCASVGPDSFAVAAVSSTLKRRFGRAAYFWSFCRLLIRWPRVCMTVRCDGRESECEAVYVAKGRHFAGPWSFAPTASTLEPVLHVVTLERASRRRFVRFAFQVLLGRSVDGLDGVRCFQCTELAVRADTGAPVQADGDIVTRLPTAIAISRTKVDFA
jgi:diacylglycerol kinase (ATP)